ncbi:MAG: gamma-glutamyltransferase [Ignavibacteria bacterium 13_1_40CM_2_61_4]|nr:MAG: gamma-glutamyltransferase [Ignavibacteria bacterium 13_1_40CM_2_61_4]
MARNGFAVDRRFEHSLESCKADMSGFPSTMSIFSRNGVLLKEGDTLRQPDLAATLIRIQEKGTEGFYKGETARLIVEEMRRGGGIMTQKDLEDYQAIVREPVKGSYRGYEILSAPLPSSGGLCALEILNIMEGYDLASMGWHSSGSVHLIAESMKRVYADRAEFMGDPQYVDAPVRVLISKPYAGERRKEIDPSRAAESSSVRHGSPRGTEGQHTTHFCTVDESGTIVSTTYTLNDLFGCKAVVGGAGFLLNDEMDDFSAKPGVPNAYGLIGGDANAIAPGKRPLSSMTPTIVLKGSRPFLALGARGGSKIITAVVQAISNVIDFGMGPQEAVDAPRFHHQWMPDSLVYEKFCFPRDVIQNLEQKGHRIRESDGPLGELEVIAFDAGEGWIYGAPDSREGGVAVGY